MVAAAIKFKRCMLLRRKVMTNIDIILKSRDITLPTKVHLVKTMVFPVVMLEMEMATNSSILAWRIQGTGAWWAAIYGVT